jgi:hypothetical protein
LYMDMQTMTSCLQCSIYHTFWIYREEKKPALQIDMKLSQDPPALHATWYNDVILHHGNCEVQNCIALW